VSNRLDRQLPRIVADPLRLRAVLDNILVNALKYTPSGGTVPLEARVPPATPEKPETVSISITDTGPGIPSAFHSRIFDKFFRFEHYHTETRPALAERASAFTCVGRLEVHGGTITCGAGLGGSGTRITVTLPITPQRSALANERSSSCRMVTTRRAW
jgi:signal transduction histidine kinase